MIAMKQASLALHSHNVPGYLYRMDSTYVVPKTYPVCTLVDLIGKTADQAPDGRLNNVILNCHGEPGYLHMGVGIGSAEMGFFKRLRGKSIGTIWIVACQVGGLNDVYNLDPAPFCNDLAKATGCDVVSSDSLQYVDAAFERFSSFVPNGYIDDYEGVVTRYSPSGKTKILGQDGSGVYDR